LIVHAEVVRAGVDGDSEPGVVLVGTDPGTVDAVASGVVAVSVGEDEESLAGGGSRGWGLVLLAVNFELDGIVSAGVGEDGFGVSSGGEEEAAGKGEKGLRKGAHGLGTPEWDTRLDGRCRNWGPESREKDSRKRKPIYLGVVKKRPIAAPRMNNRV
jgi:hypothetical protein